MNYWNNHAHNEVCGDRSGIKCIPRLGFDDVHSGAC